MGASDVLNHLRSAGLALTLTHDNRLKATPANALTDELRSAIRAHKPVLVAHLLRERVNVGIEPHPDERLSVESANDSAPVQAAPDRWCWPHSQAMNTREIDTLTARLARFTDRGLAMEEAERLADVLITRDREADDRALCVECAHLHQGVGHRRCGNYMQAGVARDLSRDFTTQLQRCPGFNSYMRGFQ